MKLSKVQAHCLSVAIQRYARAHADHLATCLKVPSGKSTIAQAKQAYEDKERAAELVKTLLPGVQL